MAVLNNEEFLQLVEKVYAFHTRRAPGIPIAIEMVNRAKERLGDVQKLCAIAETRVCLSDAIQYVAGCTIGNGDLKVLESLGRYAMTLYDRKTGKGVQKC
jgi:formylmethanofuran dehydrogenase subunit E